MTRRPAAFRLGDPHVIVANETAATFAMKKTERSECSISLKMIGNA